MSYCTRVQIWPLPPGLLLAVEVVFTVLVPILFVFIAGFDVIRVVIFFD